MSVTLTPYDKQNTILIYTFEGDWRWTEFIAVDNDVWDYFEATDERIDLIFDLTHSHTIPLGLGDIIQRAGRRTAPPHRGLGVIVNPPMILPIMLGAMRRIYPRAAAIYRTVNTQDEAIQLIMTDRNQ